MKYLKILVRLGKGREGKGREGKRREGKGEGRVMQRLCSVYAASMQKTYS